MDTQPHFSDLKKTYNERSFSVFTLTRQLKEPGHTIEYPTIHSALIFTVTGSAEISFGGMTFTADPETVVHGCPGQIIRFSPLNNEAYEHINIYYSAGSTEKHGSGVWMERPYAFTLEYPQEILTRLAALVELGKDPTLEHRLSQIIGTTMLIKGLFNVTNGQVGRKFSRVRAYLETHYTEKITLSDLGRIAGMPPQKLSHGFRRAYGVTPMAFLIAFRLDQANQLLATDMLVKDIANMVGYQDPFYFSRLYKKRFGCSPEAARARQALDCLDDDVWAEGGPRQRNGHR